MYNINQQSKSPYIDSSYVINQTIFESIQDIAVCTICTGLVVSPQQCATCEYLFCNSCIKEWMTKSKTCPHKCVDFVLKEPSRVIKSILSRVYIKCPKSCNSQIKYEEILLHYNKCESKFVDCPTCGSHVSENLVNLNTSFAQLKIENEILRKRILDLESSNNTKTYINTSNSITSNCISVDINNTTREKKPKQKNFKNQNEINNAYQHSNVLQNDKPVLSNNLIDIDKYTDQLFSSCLKEENVKKKPKFLKNKFSSHKDNSKILFKSACCGKFYDCVSCHDKTENHILTKFFEISCQGCSALSKNIYDELCYSCGALFSKEESVQKSKPIRSKKYTKDISGIDSQSLVNNRPQSSKKK